ncbi:MAG: OmpA family protein [Prevotellaceae bacterium]|jgi:outer membrane protein OmpA-like peptidoglycan-associated protein/Tol biopolymer transport system component|nr:OmpA family protein [Prevotellaceae bacterium]
MKRILFTTVTCALIALASHAAAQNQNIEFSKAYFPDQKKGLSDALSNIKSGDKLFEQGEWNAAEALQYYELANAFNPNNASLNYKIGRCLFVVNQKEKALTHFQKALELNPNVEEDILWWMAQLYHANEEMGKAIQMYNAYRGTQSKVAISRWSEIGRRIQQCEKGMEMMAHPARVFITNIGNTINTEYHEYSPVINADGSIIFFTSTRPDATKTKKSKDGENFENIYYAVRTGDRWGYPVNPGVIVNGEDNNASAGLSPDAQTLFVFQSTNGGDIFECKLDGETWSKPTAFNKHVNTRYHESKVSLSPDGRKLYFISDRPGGIGKQDIYVSEQDAKGRWGEAYLLPAVVNTPDDEEAIFSHPDGKTLYFSSKGHRGMGGYDIFKTTFENGVWSAPENLGYPINTASDDVFFSISASGRHGYYSSERKGGLGKHDIYIITFLGEEKPMINNSEDNLLAWRINPIAEQVIEKAIALNTSSMTLLKGRVIDKATSEPLEAVIVLTDIEKNEELALFKSNSVTGSYMVSLPSGKNYGITVMAEKYLFYSENFNVPKTAGYQEIEQEIRLEKLEVGSKIVLRNIFFDFGKATLRPESKSELNRLVQLMNDTPSLIIEISGHTDNIGSAQSNKALSERRAKSVVDYLKKEGIVETRLSYKGYGMDQPIAPNDTDENRQLNRRTEFKVISN